MTTQGFDHVRLIEHHQVRRRPDLEPEVGDIDRPRRVDRNHVVEPVDLCAGGHPQQVRREEGDLQHVVAAEGIVGVGNVVLAEADEDAFAEQFLDPGVQRPGVRIADHRHPGALQGSHQPMEIRQGIEAHRPAVMGERAAPPAPPDRLQRHRFQRSQSGVAGIVEQHRHVLVERLGEVEADPDVPGGVGVGVFDPRNAGDHVGAQLHRLAHQFGGARFADDAVLGERRDLDIDDPLELLAHRDQRLDAFQPRLAVDVRERPDVEVAVDRRQGDGAPRVVGDPRRVVVVLDDARQLDGGHRLAHPRRVVVGERRLFHHRQRPHLAQVEMAVDEGLGHQIAPGIDLARGGAVEAFLDPGYATVRDPDVEQPIRTIAQTGPPDEDVVSLTHRLPTLRTPTLPSFIRRFPQPSPVEE